MTVTVAPRYKRFNGNDTTGPFSFTFPILLSNSGTPYITVKRISSSGEETTLAYSTDYTFSALLLGKGGGIITTTVMVATGEQLFVEATTPLDQQISFRNQGEFSAESHENGFDKVHFILIENVQKADLSIKFPSSEIGVGTTLPVAALRANTTLGFDGSGNLLCGSVTTTIVSTPMTPVVQAPTIADARTAMGLGSAATQDTTAFDVAGSASAVQTALSGNTPVGVVFPYAGTSAPTGFLFCYGQAVSRTTYANLFTAIGTTYGSGDGSTTFNVPDLRGRVIAGQDDMGGTSANRLTGLSGGVDGDVLGGTGGEEAHALSIAELAAHTHFGFAAEVGTTVAGDSVSVSNTQQVDVVGRNGSDTRNYNLKGTSTEATVGLTSSTGSGTAHNTVQPTIILNYIIKH